MRQLALLMGLLSKRLWSQYKIASDITVIIIAHRLNTVKHCDMIYYMEEGKVIDNGDYDGLMQSNAHFNDLSKTS